MPDLGKPVPNLFGEETSARPQAAEAPDVGKADPSLFREGPVELEAVPSPPPRRR